jgi:Methyltransferase domain
MTIVYASEASGIRPEVINYLAQMRTLRPDSKIVDFGGSMGSEFRPYLTDIVDFNPPNIDNNHNIIFHAFDLHSPELWEQFPDNYFDFAICTHTLEDIRDPRYVVQQISRVAKSGFMAVPNRHQEMSHVESPYYLGYCHHRWIFHHTQEGLLALAKFAPLARSANWFDRAKNGIFDFRKRYLPGKRFAGSRFDSLLIKQNWIDENLVENPSTSFELSILWNGSIDLQYFNSDYAGNNKGEFFDLANRFLQLPFKEIKPENIKGSLQFSGL